MNSIEFLFSHVLRMAMAFLMKYLSAWAPKQKHEAWPLCKRFSPHRYTRKGSTHSSAVQWQFVQSLSALREPRLLGRWARPLRPRPGRSQQDMCFSLFIWSHRRVTWSHFPLVQSKMMACDVLWLVDLLAGCVREARAWEKGVCVLKIQKLSKS